MGVHDKVVADQVWVRPHSSEHKAPQKSIGQFFFMFQAPNYKERIEMSYRTLGRMWDWDLERFRLSRKANDKGNRRRLLRNLVRLVKNPGGYVLWKTWKWNQFPRLWIYLLLISVPAYFMDTVRMTEMNERRMHWIKVQGGTRPESFLQPGEDRNSRINIPMTGLWQATYSYLPTNFLVANPAYKQNYRLYFDRMPYVAN